MKFNLLSLAVLILSFLSMCRGSMQSCSLQGPPGQPGIPGTPGTPGIPGTPGTLASGGCSGCGVQDGGRGRTVIRRWKQCAWTFDDTKDQRDSGKIHECEFVKEKSDSYLRVVYMGNLRITGCRSCCNRWYVTFNGAECNTPAPIDGAIFHASNINIHRPSNIEGYCGGIAAGKVRVAVNLGKCPRAAGGSFTHSDAWTGWNQSNRIIIEEVEPPVA